MKYLSKSPIVFSAPKGGWPTDWAEKPISGECVDALIDESKAASVVREMHDSDWDAEYGF